MNEIKPGQQFWEGPRTNAGLSDLLADGRIPHSPALPALARLLNDEPGLAEAVDGAMDALWEQSQNNEGWRGRRDERIDDPLRQRAILTRLAAALATKEDGDGNG